LPAPLRLLHLITSTDLGGAETQLARFLAASPPGRYEHLVCGLMPAGPLARVMADAGARVTSLGLSRGPAALWRGVGAVRKLLARERPALVQTWMYHADLLGLLAARLPPRPGGGAPVVWGLRCADLDLASYAPATRLVVKACAALSGRPAAIAVNSQAGLDFHQGLGYPAAKMRLIPNGFDTALFRPDASARATARAELGLNDEQVLIGQVARVDPNKDHATFIAAARLLAERAPQARFLFLGQGTEPGSPALAACEEPPLAGRCHRLGRREDVPRWLNALDVFAQSSASEGLPNALGEAMSVGLMCVATQAGDSALLLGQTGLLAPIRQPAALAEALAQALALDPAQRAQIGAAARQRITQGYSLAAAHQAWWELYQEVLGRVPRLPS
jgi:glycosyltransferase involved in cell wall biosynthesis